MGLTAGWAGGACNSQRQQARWIGQRLPGLRLEAAQLLLQAPHILAAPCRKALRHQRQLVHHIIHSSQLGGVGGAVGSDALPLALIQGCGGEGSRRVGRATTLEACTTGMPQLL